MTCASSNDTDQCDCLSIIVFAVHLKKIWQKYMYIASSETTALHTSSILKTISAGSCENGTYHIYALDKVKYGVFLAFKDK